jgi:hypothetical protein
MRPITQPRAALFALLLTGSFIGLAPQDARAQAAADAGHVTRLRGEASAEAAGSAKHALAQGDALHEGDRVTTGGNSRLEITLADGTLVTLGDASDLTIDQFVYDPAGGKGNGALRLTAGVFRAITGGIAKLPGEPLHVSTPIATVGIRGTDFWGEQRADHLLLALLGGRSVVVETRGGRVEITQKNYVTEVTGAGAAPTAPTLLSPAQLKAAIATVAF